MLIFFSLLSEDAILALHDISDGGLVVCLLEMCVAGWGGANVDIPPAPAPPPTSTDQVPPILAALFSEEVGYVAYDIVSVGKKIITQLRGFKRLIH